MVDDTHKLQFIKKGFVPIKHNIGRCMSDGISQFRGT